MDLTDSNEKLLPGPEIVAQSVYNQPQVKYSPDVVMNAIAAETTLPNTDIIQVGNTVFMGHTGTGKNKHKMVGRAFNADTGLNFVKNAFKYTRYLQEKGITHYSTTFTGPVFLNAFKVFQRRARGTDTEIGIGRLKKDPNQFVVYMRIGKEPIAKGV